MLSTAAAVTAKTTINRLRRIREISKQQAWADWTKTLSNLMSSIDANTRAKIKEETTRATLNLRVTLSPDLKHPRFADTTSYQRTVKSGYDNLCHPYIAL